MRMWVNQPPQHTAGHPNPRDCSLYTGTPLVPQLRVGERPHQVACQTCLWPGWGQLPPCPTPRHCRAQTWPWPSLLLCPGVCWGWRVMAIFRPPSAQFAAASWLQPAGNGLLRTSPEETGKQGKVELHWAEGLSPWHMLRCPTGPHFKTSKDFRRGP